MRTTTGDFAKGRLSTIILRLALPMMAAEFVNVLYNLVDRMYIGHMPDGGTLALTGIGISFPLVTLIGAFASLLGSGGTPLFSIIRGKGDQEKARRIMTTSFTMVLLAGLILTVLLYFFSPLLLSLLGGDQDTLPAALSYFRIYVLGTIPVMITLGMNAYINAQGFALRGTATVVISAALNIILDPIFIFVLDMGIAGAALATVLAQTASAVWILIFLTGKLPPLKLGRPEIDAECARDILKLGVTGFTFRITNSITQAIVNISLKAWGGVFSTLYVGAMSLINSIREVTGLPVSGLVNGAQPVISYNYGAGENKRVSGGIRFTLCSGLTVNTLLWVLMMLIPEKLLGIFTPDQALIDIAAPCARIFFGAFPFMALQLTGQNTFVALNKPKQALFFSLLRKMLLVAPLTLLLPNLGLGVNGVFWAEFISQVIGASACFLTMTFTIWRKL